MLDAATVVWCAKHEDMSPNFLSAAVRFLFWCMCVLYVGVLTLRWPWGTVEG